MIASPLSFPSWKSLLFVALAGTVAFSVPMCRQAQQQAAQATQNVHTVLDSARLVRLADSSTITSQRQLLVSSRAEVAKLSSQVQGLTNLKSQVRYVSTFSAPISRAPIRQPIYRTDSVDRTRYLKVPARFGLNANWYTYAGTVGEDGAVTLDTLSVRLQTSVSFGDATRKWYQLLKPYQPTVAVVEQNPYATVSKLQNVVFAPPPPRFSIGLQAGYGMLPVQRTFGPYVGLGIQWQILSSRPR